MSPIQYIWNTAHQHLKENSSVLEANKREFAQIGSENGRVSQLPWSSMSIVRDPLPTTQTNLI